MSKYLSRKRTEVNIVTLQHEKIYELLTAADKKPIGIALAEVHESELHYHDKTQEYYWIINGHAEVMLNGNKLILEPETLLYIPVTTKHRAKQVGREKLRLLAISYPPWTPEDHHVVER